VDPSTLQVSGAPLNVDLMSLTSQGNTIPIERSALDACVVTDTQLEYLAVAQGDYVYVFEQ